MRLSWLRNKRRLLALMDNPYTDKNTTHSYLTLYQNLLESKRESAQNILEIGIGDFAPKNGGSIKMWYDFFPGATIYGLDILSIDRVIDELKNNSRIKLFTSIDAYNETFFKQTLYVLKV